MATAKADKVFRELLRYMESLSLRFHFHEEAVGDAVVKAITKGYLKEDGFHGLENWKGWIYRTARRLSLRAARRERFFQPLLTEPGVSHDDDLVRREEADALQSAIDQLDSGPRGLFVYCVVEGRSRSKAAIEFSLPLGTVHRRLATAFSRLRDHLRSAGFDIPAWRKSKIRRARSAS